jgi:hypothetical protein
MASTAGLRGLSLCDIRLGVGRLGGSLESVPVLLCGGGLRCGAGDGRLGWEVRAPEGGRGRGGVRGRAWRWDDDEILADAQATFAEGVTLFNAGEYYECHDILEGLWNNAPEPQRSVLHGILQCAVGLYHLLNQVLGFLCFQFFAILAPNGKCVLNEDNICNYGVLCVGMSFEMCVRRL